MYVVAIVRYLLVNSSQYINVQPDSGNVILVGSLQGTDITSIDLSIRATDGQLSSNATFQLTVFISDRNIYAPRFDSHEYRINVSESTPSGSSILRLTATDQDSPILYYFVIDGNDGNRFRVDSSTGQPSLSFSDSLGFLNTYRTELNRHLEKIRINYN